MFLHLINAKYLEDYKVAVSFNDGREGVADLFEALKNKSKFLRLYFSSNE